jgi:adenosyl cobinamide kinase/adenosyl cobinamide phosphate guanylyltransferase
VDAEMAERIARHRAARPQTWRTIESPVGLRDRVVAEDAMATTLIVEDLTLLLSNLMERDSPTAEAHAISEVNALLALDVHVILVANEVGMGVVPAYPLGRVFRDAMGRVNQAAAAACGEVYLTVAGLPLRLK